MSELNNERMQERLITAFVRDVSERWKTYCSIVDKVLYNGREANLTKDEAQILKDWGNSIWEDVNRCKRFNFKGFKEKIKTDYESKFYDVQPFTCSTEPFVVNGEKDA